MQLGHAAGTCFNCGRPWGNGCACQFCSQMYGFPLGVTVSSAGKRFIGYLLESVLILATCGVGWLIWAFVIFGNGQTPAKQLMGMRVVNVTTGVRSGWGRMFVREFIVKFVIGFVLGWLILPYFWLLWDRNKQQLWDKLIDTGVVDDPNGLVGTVPQAASPYLQQPQQQYQLPPSEQPTLWGRQAGDYGQPGSDDPQGGYGQHGPYGQPGGYGQYGGYGQQGGYGQPQYPPPPSAPPNPPDR